MDQFHTHKTSGRLTYGRQLQPGETIEASDVYDSTNGTWELAPCSGLKLGEGVDTVWVRPAK